MKETHPLLLVDPVSRVATPVVNTGSRLLLAGVILCCAICFPASIRAGETRQRPAVGVTGVIVQSRFGGQIFDFWANRSGSQHR